MTEGEAATATPEGETQSLEDIEQLVAESEEQGYFGETPDYDRDAYTLQTFESPSTLDVTLTPSAQILPTLSSTSSNSALTRRAQSAKTRAWTPQLANGNRQERRSARQTSKES